MSIAAAGMQLMQLQCKLLTCARLAAEPVLLLLLCHALLLSEFPFHIFSNHTRTYLPILKTVQAAERCFSRIDSLQRVCVDTEKL